MCFLLVQVLSHLYPNPLNQYFLPLKLLLIILHHLPLPHPTLHLLLPLLRDPTLHQSLHSLHLNHLLLQYPPHLQNLRLMLLLLRFPPRLLIPLPLLHRLIVVFLHHLYFHQKRLLLLLRPHFLHSQFLLLLLQLFLPHLHLLPFHYLHFLPQLYLQHRFHQLSLLLVFLTLLLHILLHLPRYQLD